jgi:hypothetical protein
MHRASGGRIVTRRVGALQTRPDDRIYDDHDQAAMRWTVETDDFGLESAAEAPGRCGQEQIFNFIEIGPYHE